MSNLSGTTPVQQARKAFWLGLQAHAKQSGRTDNPFTVPATTDYWYSTPVGKRGYHITLHCLFSKGLLRAGLYFYSEATYRNYYLQRKLLEEILGSPLTLPRDPVPKVGMKKILLCVSRYADLHDPDTHFACYDWLMDMHDRLRLAVGLVDP